MKKSSNKHKNELNAARIVVNLNREEFEFVDKIGRDALFSTGRRLTNNKIIRAIVAVIKGLDINGIGLHNCEELKNRLFVALGVKREMRMYPRFRKEAQVFWRKLDSMAEYEKDQTTDIGQGGFRVVIPAPASAGVNSAGIHKVGEVLEFTIIDPSMPDEPIKALGRIAWVRTHKDTKAIQAGIQLTYLPEKERDRFNKLFCEGKREVMKNE